MISLLQLIATVINIYVWCLVINVAMTWLISFNILNTRNQFVARVNDFFNRITEPALAPIRRVVPLIGGIDVSPIILILLLVFIKHLLFELFLGYPLY
jgi:YggT family protein